VAARFTDTMELGDVKVTSEALGFEASEDLLPEVMTLVSAVFERVAPAFAAGEISGMDDIVKLLPALGAIAMQLGGGRLKALAPKILAGTSITMPGADGTKEKYDLVKKDERTACFDARPDVYFQVLFFAGRVTFGRFFPASAQPRKDSPKAT
jgi:hypothetical protein